MASTAIHFLLALAVAGTTSALSLVRPTIQPFPLTTGSPAYFSPLRDSNKTCTVPASVDGSDAAPAILSAFQTCNNGGTIVLDASYNISSPLNLTFLSHVDVALTGTVSFNPDIAFWTRVDGAYPITYQNSSTFWKLGGEDVNIYGGGVGTLDGNGEVWWDAHLTNSSLVRPILFVADGLQGATISGLNFVNPPNWFNLIANSSDVVVSGLNLSAVWSTGEETPNSDGWDIYRSDSIVLQDSIVNNGDDCVSFKPNSTNIVVQNLYCNGSHGISVGSLGQYVNEYDIAENITVYNISMSNAGDGARIKVWPGIESTLSTLLNGGGGSGYVKNVTYQLFNNTNNDWSIEVNQCYGQSNATLCELYPSKMTISEIYFKDFYGVTSTKNEPYVGTLVCSGPEQCSDFYASNVNVTPPNGEAPKWVCSGFNTTGLQGFDCDTTES
ncbi:hypothetical protein N0V93_002210 [Gnomoniopsis smithogilvyi]|uniref:galacturonan 1,4-alpha-galacturonidase n=1 Tax=Gnomoniopsis smithogilvyi TaxID=1191159 RepID=A0A9W8YW22_9PEZI|nr:hypothetical protein N0V93_002210 [Gnomoniopsis smithogilvyi]